MVIETRDLDDLAVFFSRRYPDSPDAPARLARLAGVTQRSGVAPTWTSILAAAAEQGRVRAVADAALREQPGDVRLGELVRLLSPPARTWPAVAAGVAAFSVTLGLMAAVGLWALSGEADAAPGDASDTSTLVLGPAPAESAASTQGVEETVQSPDTAVAATQATAPAGLSGPPVDGCRAAEGELVGWYHAGAESPGKKGDLVVLGGGARVRADYPQASKGWRLSPNVRCTLSRGEHLRLQADPVAIPGDSVWVPVHGGSRLGSLR